MDNSSQIIEASHILQSGGVVAFPTETVYGLGANVFNTHALEHIFYIKKRPADNPLIVHIASLDMLPQLVKEISPYNQKLIDHFWPGPLGIVFPKSKLIPDIVTAHLDTVVIRFPSNPIAQELINTCGFPIAAPSVNPSGKPSSTHHSHVKDYFGDQVFVIEGDASTIGIESTVITTLDKPRILRQGAITQDEIEQVLEISLDHTATTHHLPQSPGMKYPHYAPNAPIHLASIQDNILDTIATYTKQGYIVGALVSSEIYHHLPNSVIGFDLGSQGDYPTLSARLYDGLHFFDSSAVNLIIAESFHPIGMGIALMDRLSRAASNTPI